MASNKCKYCKWYKINNVWTSLCNNPNCVYEGAECIEQIGAESEPCDKKEK